MSVIVIVVAILFALMGVAALVRPALMWGWAGIEPSTPGARSEVRGVYGGFGLVIAGLLLYAEGVIGGGASAGVRDGILLTAAGSLFGMAGGRLFSGLFEPKSLLGWPGLFMLLEAAGGLLTCAAK